MEVGAAKSVVLTANLADHSWRHHRAADLPHDPAMSEDEAKRGCLLTAPARVVSLPPATW